MSVEADIQAWIATSKRGDRSAFGRLVRQYQPMVYGLAFRLLGSHEEACDAVQDTFVKLWLNIGRYKAEWRMSTWLYKIACNLCYDKMRAAKPIESLDAAPDVAASDNVEADIIRAEQVMLIRRIASQLTPTQRLVFTLHEVEELSTEEIVAATGLSADSIKSNLYLARKNVRQRIVNSE